MQCVSAYCLSALYFISSAMGNLYHEASLAFVSKKKNITHRGIRKRICHIGNLTNNVRDYNEILCNLIQLFSTLVVKSTVTYFYVLITHHQQAESAQSGCTQVVT